MSTYWHLIPNRYKDATFNTFHPQTDAQKRACFYLAQKAQTGLTQNVLLLGSCGSGKTHLCYSFLKTQKTSDATSIFPFCPSQTCFMTSIKDILDEIKAGFKKETVLSFSNTIQKAIEAPILILDEVGVQYGSDMERTELYRLFNERYNAMRPTIIVSNLEKNKLLPLLGKRICDRLFADAVIFTFQCKSHRQERPHATD